MMKYEQNIFVIEAYEDKSSDSKSDCNYTV